MFGMPKQGDGFSNNVFGTMGRSPGFEKASLRLENDRTIVIQLDY